MLAKEKAKYLRHHRPPEAEGGRGVITRMVQSSPLDPLQLQPELSFVGVRKVVITKTSKDEEQKQSNGYRENDVG